MNKFLLLFGLLLLSSVASLSQDYIDDKKNEIAEVLIRKQLIVNDLENQVKDIPYAVVRVFARYKTAQWLWKDGKDDTGRAMEIAVAAVDDFYINKSEIPVAYSYNASLFVLLDTHAKDAAKDLREKYKLSVDDEALITSLLFGQKDGERRAVDYAVRQLSRQNEKSPDLVYLLMRLDQQGSPELNRLLSAILAAEQAGRTGFHANMIQIFSNFFIKPNVPVEIQRQFFSLIVARTRNAAALAINEQWTYYSVLQRLLPEISTKYPEILGEASTAHTLLSAKVDRSTREANERNERINDSSDKLAATVAEAERANDDTIKHGLYRSAARLALKENKFIYAVDLMEKASQIDISASGIKEDTLKSGYEQFYGDVVTKALQASEPDAANHAVKKMNTPLSKADGLARISTYYIDKKDLDSGRYAHDEAIKLVSRAENSSESIALLLKMIPTAQKIDPSRVFEVNQMIARSINAIPSLNAEDQPETKNYQDYLKKIMTINLNLVPALTSLVKENRNAAADLASRIDKKEIKIVANFVLLTDSITQGMGLSKGEESTLRQE